MRRSFLMFIAAGLLMGLAGCGGLDDPDFGTPLDILGGTSAKEGTKPEIPEGAITDDSGEFFYDGALQQVGDDENGYIQIPLGFVAFQEEGIEGLTQYSDATGRNIVTLECYEGIDYQMAAENMRYYLESNENVDDMRGAMAQMAGYNALQLYGHYTDGYFFVTWFIEDPDNPSNSYYLAIEYDSEHSYLIACSSTFQTVDDYHAAE